MHMKYLKKVSGKRYYSTTQNSPVFIFFPPLVSGQISLNTCAVFWALRRFHNAVHTHVPNTVQQTKVETKKKQED